MHEFQRLQSPWELLPKKMWDAKHEASNRSSAPKIVRDALPVHKPLKLPVDSLECGGQMPHWMGSCFSVHPTKAASSYRFFVTQDCVQPNQPIGDKARESLEPLTSEFRLLCGSAFCWH